VGAIVQGIRDRDALVAHIATGARVRFLFFWGHASRGDDVGPHVLSQWAPTPFMVDDVRYLTAEHFMMAEKARLFGDDALRNEIITSASPGKAKALGRAVANFDEAVWTAARFDIVVRGSEAKFRQNDRLRTYLMQTGDKVLVEASPRDGIWGIGLAADHPDTERPAAWPGLNLLGFALMEARARFAAGDGRAPGAAT
jgi:ribA/ribD-fused uncharacterized protein